MSDQSDDNNLLRFVAATVEGMRDEMATMRNEMATKEDLARIESRLVDKIETETTAIRGDIEQVHLRLDSIFSPQRR